MYGLPIVMNYATMYEYAVDHNSPQFKAPFNQLKNEPNVFTYKDTAIVTPNSDTPYSFAWMDFRAEPVVLSVVHRCCIARLRGDSALQPVRGGDVSTHAHHWRFATIRGDAAIQSLSERSGPIWQPASSYTAAVGSRRARCILSQKRGLSLSIRLLNSFVDYLLPLSGPR
jgi:hypothetical protein